MNAHVDPDTPHACYSPSSAHRWTVCTASATAIAALGEQEEGDAAKKGTAAHSEIERVLGPLARDGIAELDIDSEHASAYGIALMFDYVRQLVHSAPGGGRLWIEERVHLTEQIWGRLDVGHWDPISETVTVADYKDGFVDVDAEWNEQLRIYAAALIQQFKLPAKWIRYAVIQPNSFLPVPRVKQFVESAESLFAFASKTAAIPRGALTFKAGGHCRYCPIFGKCAPTIDLLAQLSIMLQHSPREVRPETRAAIMAVKRPIEDWFKGADKDWTKDALTGVAMDGMKVVQTVKHLAWKDDAAAKAAIVAKLGVDALDPPTPAHAKKLGMPEDDVAALAERPDGGPALAFASDKRPEWKAKSAAEMFAGVVGGSH
jgi:hypothetical protein